MTRPPLKSFDSALAELLAQAQPLTTYESIDTFDADGRVLAQDLISAVQVPPLDNSAMDGYALRCADVPQPGTELPVTQRIAAGSVGQPLQAGSAARIFTGAPIPAGADAVVMQEACEALDEGVRVRVHAALHSGQNIRRAGEDIAQGATVLHAGTRLTPAALGLAASVGQAQLSVVRRPRVALLCTGDELILPGQIPPEAMPPGAIYNSNRFFLRAMLQRMGCEVTDLGNVPDQRQATIEALRHASREHDVIVTSGGVSVGEEDHIKPAVQALGQLDLWQIAIKPGKPFAYGRIARHGSAEGSAVHFLGLPGNPVASFVTCAVLVRPFLLHLQGTRPCTPPFIAARADFDWPKADKRREFLRVCLQADGSLALFPRQGSGVLTSAASGDGVVDNPPGHTIAKGDSVRFIPFGGLFS